MSGEISRQDHLIHDHAIVALKHHYAHGDSGLFNRLVAEMPESNRKKALLFWILTYTKAEWNVSKQTFTKRTGPLDQKLEDAIATPFWTFKKKQIQRRHVSGNSFDPNLFFERVMDEIHENLDLVSSSRITKMIHELQQILSKK